MSRLLIIDGHAVIHRAYHSIPKNLTYNGQVVNALYGFYSMLLSSISQLNPKYLIICLDSPGPTFRDKEYIAYRAQRQPSDPELISQLPLVKQTLEEITIPSFALGGYEADDIIATIAKNKAPLVSKVTIITGDKDLMQLVNTKTQLFMPIRGISQTKTFFIKDVKQKLGIYPKQVVDMKALMGDPSDNYPGVHGIGPKTATTLLNQYKNLDNIYKNINKIKASLKNKLIKDKENAYLSQKLAQLVYDVPIKFSLKSAMWNEAKKQNLLKLFKTYNFKSLISRLEKQTKPKITPSPTNQQSLF